MQECWIIGNRSDRLEFEFSLGCLCLPVVFKTKKDIFVYYYMLSKYVAMMTISIFSIPFGIYSSRRNTVFLLT